MGGTDTWQEATVVNADAREGHGLVGPGEIIGVVTQMLTAPLQFKRLSFAFFFCVELCSRGFSFAGDVAALHALDQIARRRI